jgi:hypothetical protein
MDKRFKSILRDFDNGELTRLDLKWLIHQVQDKQEMINDLEQTAQRWMQRSISDTEKLRVSTKRIKELESALTRIASDETVTYEQTEIIALRALKKPPYMDLDD